MKDAGPPGASSNGFNENLALFQQGKCGMWIDATVAGLLRVRSEAVDGRRQGRLRARAGQRASASAATGCGPGRSPFRPARKKAEAAEKFIAWATGKDYAELVAAKEGWANVPPGTRTSLYANPDYQKAAPFAKMTLDSINAADPTQSDRQAGALYRRAVRRHPRVPGPRHDGRPALLGGACRPDRRSTTR